tara:strand:- start:233 stop:487 length:255 start_codon:yes stop_codon:yes gene_type:complete
MNVKFRSQVKQFENEKGEIVNCSEIATCYPSDTWWELNKKQRQEAADRNNNGKLGKAGRFYNSTNGVEMWVDTEARVWWVEDCR